MKNGSASKGTGVAGAEQGVSALCPGTHQKRTQCRGILSENWVHHKIAVTHQPSLLAASVIWSIN